MEAEGEILTFDQTFEPQLINYETSRFRKCRKFAKDPILTSIDSKSLNKVILEIASSLFMIIYVKLINIVRNKNIVVA